MSEKVKIYIKNIEEYVEINGGESLTEIYELVADKIPFEPICAHVNNRNQSLHYVVYHPRMVEFLPATSASGMRTYVRSLCMMLYKAVEELLPGTRLQIQHSISHGYYCRLTGDVVCDKSTAEALKKIIRRLIEEDLPFEYNESFRMDVMDIFSRQGLDEKVRLLSTLTNLYQGYYTLDGLADSYYSVLAPSTGMIRVFDLVPYKEGFLLTAFDPKNPEENIRPAAQEKMYAAFTDYLAFNRIVGVRNVGELNEAVERGDSAMLINVSETLHDKRIATIADDISKRYRDGGARIVLVAGPSSSGKTTFTKRLGIHLMTNLLEPQVISLDNYFVDRHHTPLDENGEHDYESLYALDLETFNSDLNRLLNGEVVSLPYYNFETGEREYRGDTAHLGDRSILLIEGIHGLNPELTAMIDRHQKYLIYVSALTTISIDDHNWIPSTDNRLIRRIIRDRKYRGCSATETLRRWPSVRRGEEKWIFPYQENADAMFNSALLFELGVMKSEGEIALADVPHNTPEYAEAARLQRFLGYFHHIDERYVPSTSLLREFLGGSTFKY